MDIELGPGPTDKRLNRMVAITVVILSVFMGLCNIKDGNIVQAMQQAQSDSVDRWGEYQADKTKAHIAATAATQIALLVASHPSAAGNDALAALSRDQKRYTDAAPVLRTQALGFTDRYDALNVHDDQFDASEALITTAISVAAVAALVESIGLLLTGWVFGAGGIFMGICGFAGLAFHPDVLSNLLG